mgnify:CR=1 FL=1
MFEKASRLKARFDTPNGVLSVEDLWDLPLTSARRANLDDIAKGLNREVKATEEESFVTPRASNAELGLKFEGVKHIIAVRVQENEAERTLTEKKRQRERIMEIMAQKQDSELASKSLEELQGLLAAL